MIDVTNLDLKSKNIVVYNLNDNKVLYEKNADEKVSIASLTKIMTTITAIEEIDNLDKKVTITNKMLEGLTEANASVAGFNVGDVLTYRDLLYGTLLPSGADATRALAYSLFGSESEFVKKMNEKSKSLGLSNTNFVNTSGLDEKGGYSTVKEVATILKYALNNSIFKEIYTSKTYKTSNGKYTLGSTFNSYLTKYSISMPTVYGSKTGYTDNAGYCLSTVASKDKENYMIISTGVDKNIEFPYHVTDAKKIYDYLYDNYYYLDVLTVGEEILTLKTRYSDDKERKIISDKEIYNFFPKDIDRSDLEYTYEGAKVVTPFTNVNKKLGEYKITYNEQVLATLDVYLKDKISFSLGQFLIQNIFFIILIIVFIILAKIRREKKRLIKKGHHRN